MNNKRCVITIHDLKHGIDTKTETLINENKQRVKMKIQTLTGIWSLIKRPVKQSEERKNPYTFTQCCWWNKASALCDAIPSVRISHTCWSDAFNSRNMEAYWDRSVMVRQKDHRWQEPTEACRLAQTLCSLVSLRTVPLFWVLAEVKGLFNSLLLCFTDLRF